MGHRVFFAGGWFATGFINVVDIYNTVSKAWSKASLSQARRWLGAVAADQKVFFAGGQTGAYPNYTASNVVDIYDGATGTWSTATLSQPRSGLAAASAGNKVLFAGGANNSFSNVVDVYTLQNYGSITSTKTFTLQDHTTVTGLMQLNGGNLNFSTFNLTVGSMGGDAPIDLGSGTLAVGGDNNSTTYSGAIGGSGTLVKTGSGTLTLAAGDSYSGPTSVNNGKLLLSSAGALASAVTVNPGGTFGGTGSAGSVTINGGGHISPGNSAGVLTLNGNLSLGAGALLDFDLGPPAISDLIEMPSSTLTLNNQEFSHFNFTPQPGFGPGTYTLIDAGTVVGNLGAVTSGAIGGLPASLSISGNDLVLTVAPEPSSLALFAVGVISLLAYAWRRRKQSK